MLGTIVGTGDTIFIKNILVLAGVAQWIERWPVKQKVSGLIPGQGTCLGCGPGPSGGYVRGNFSFSLSLKINK